jgi:hypothetical protein
MLYASIDPVLVEQMNYVPLTQWFQHNEKATIGDMLNKYPMWGVL